MSQPLILNTYTSYIYLTVILFQQAAESGVAGTPLFPGAVGVKTEGEDSAAAVEEESKAEERAEEESQEPTAGPSREGADTETQE